MAEPFNFELILTDFLKYMPEAKRHDYELMLRRCNFSDPADPMFPVMLFLLFFQDNLADRLEELTEEIKAQKTIPSMDHAAVAPERRGYGSDGSSTDVDCFRRFLPDIPGFSKPTNHESRHFAFQRDSEDQPLLGCKTAICTERKSLYEST